MLASGTIAATSFGHRVDVLARRPIENPTGQPYIYVTEPFYLLSISEQAAMMNVIWYYYITEDRRVDVLTIYDNESGEEIGTFGRKGIVMAE